ncbi:MAG TPA: hypothetical protein VLV30_04325 [Methanomicrobiales archaeon]|nr:hypothetical protein [Methanomicrobiales archaeon]
MAVVLQRQDGTTKKYTVSAPLSQYLGRASCGAYDCEHLPCAIVSAGEFISLFPWLVLLNIGIMVTIGGLMILILPVFREGGVSSSVSDVLGIIFLFIIALQAIMIPYVWMKRKEMVQNLSELREFSEKGTLGGKPARQVPGKAAKGG